jgi:hypothetical protein
MLCEKLPQVSQVGDLASYMLWDSLPYAEGGILAA